MLLDFYYKPTDPECKLARRDGLAPQVQIVADWDDWEGFTGLRHLKRCGNLAGWPAER